MFVDVDLVASSPIIKAESNAKSVSINNAKSVSINSYPKGKLDLLHDLIAIRESALLDKADSLHNISELGFATLNEECIRCIDPQRYLHTRPVDFEGSLASNQITCTLKNKSRFYLKRRTIASDMSNDWMLDNTQNAAMRRLVEESHVQQVESELLLEHSAAHPGVADIYTTLQMQLQDELSEEREREREGLEDAADSHSQGAHSSLWVEKYAPHSFSQVKRVIVIAECCCIYMCSLAHSPLLLYSC